MKKPKHKWNQSGQAIILIIALMVVIFGLVALAVDVGHLMWTNRDAQNGSDAATWGATRIYCENGDAQAAIAKGEEMAMANGFTTETGEYPTSVNVVANYFETTEVGAPGTSWPQTPNYATRAVITRENQPYFAQVVYPGDLTTSAVASSNCRGRNPLAQGEVAIYAFSNGCEDKDGINIANSNVVINGGAWTRSDFKATGSDLEINGPVEYAGNYQSDAVLTPSVDNPTYNPNNQVPTLFTFDQFLPGGYYHSAEEEAAGLYHYYPGNLRLNFNGPDKGTVIEGTLVIGGDFSALGDFEVGPSGVTIVSKDGISISANKVTGLKPHVAGLLLYSDQATSCGGNAISVDTSTVGTEDTNGEDVNGMQGIMYGPNGGCRIDAADTKIILAIFCNTVDLHGSNLILEYYDGIEDLMPEAALWFTE